MKPPSLTTEQVSRALVRAGRPDLASRATTLTPQGLDQLCDTLRRENSSRFDDLAIARAALEQMGEPWPNALRSSASHGYGLRFLSRLIVAGLQTVLLVISGAWLWAQHEALSPDILALSPGQGEILLFFDKPNISAVMMVEVSSDLSGQPITPGDWLDRYSVEIFVEGSHNPAGPLRYTLALSGTASLPTVYPNGSPRSPSNCHERTVSGSPGEPSCSTSRGSPQSLYAAEEYKHPVDLISGVMNVPKTADRAIAFVDFFAVGQTVAVSGDRRLFQLPTLGTTAVPGTASSSFHPVIDAPGVRFVPFLGTLATYDRLLATENLEAVAPEPTSRQPLTWTATASTITPNGAIVDTAIGRSLTNNLFLVGIGAGLVVGFVPSAIQHWVSALSIAPRGRRGSTRTPTRRST